MSAERSELRPAYRTLNEPTRLLGLSIGGWAAVLSAGAASYAWLMVSPLPWRVNFSLAAIVLGTPVALLLLREQSTITPVRLLLGVVRWRARAPLLTAPSIQRRVCRGGVRLTSDAPTTSIPGIERDDVAWPEPEDGGR